MFDNPASSMRWVSPTRRSFLREACCGFGGLALSALLNHEALARPANPLVAKAAASAAEGPVGDFSVHGRRAEPPGNVRSQAALNKLHGQPRPEEFGEAKYQFINRSQAPRQQAEVPEIRPKRHRSVRSFPHIAGSSMISPSFAPVTATGSCIRRRSTSCSRGRVVPGYPSMGSWIALRPRERRANRCRATSSCPIRTARWKRGSRCTRTAFCRPCISRRCSAPAKAVLNLDLPRGVVDERTRTHRSDSRSQSGCACERRRGTRCPHQRLRSRVPHADRSAGNLRSLASETQETLDLYGVGREPTHDYGRRCLLARRLVERGVRFVMRRLRRRSRQHAMGCPQRHRGKPPRMAMQTDQPVAGLLKDLKRRGLLDSRSCSGAASSAGRPKPRMARAAITTISASRCGWPAAASKAAESWAPPMKSASGG